MRFVALLCLVGFAAASSSGSLVPNKLKWESGTEYTFEYEGRLLSGLPEIQSQYSGLGIKCGVKVAVTRAQTHPDDRIFTVKIQNPSYVAVNDVLRTDSSVPEWVSDEGASAPGYSTAQQNWRRVKLPSYGPVSGESKTALEEPVSFLLRKDGKLESIAVNAQSEGEWSINFKKAIAVLFQTKSIAIETGLHTNEIGSQDSMSYWKTTEEGLDGVCEVDYEVTEIPKSKSLQMPFYFSEQCRTGSEKTFVVTKTRNIDSCSHRSMFNYFNPGFYRCPTINKDSSGNCEGQYTRSSITRYYTCGSSINELKIQTIYNEGEMKQDLFGEKTERFTTGTSQTLKFVSRGPVTVPSIFEQGKKIHTLSISPDVEGNHNIHGSSKNGLEGSFTGDVSELKQEIKKLIDEIVKDDLTEIPKEGKKNEISMKVLALSFSFGKLNKQDITSIYHDLKSTYSGQSEKLETMKTVFFDTVLMGGFSQNIRFVRDMALQGEMSSYQITSFFFDVPRYLNEPQETVLEDIFELLKSKVVSDVPLVYSQGILSFSALIQRSCLSKQLNSSFPVWTSGKMCDSQSQIVTDRYIPYLLHKLENPNVGPELRSEWRNLHLTALGLMQHSSIIPTLLRYVEMNEYPQGKDTPMEMVESIRMTRQIAIYSLGISGQTQPRKTSEALAAILKNQGDNFEIRITAFNVLLKMNPDMYILQSIASLTWRESNKEIISTINHAFRSIAHQKDSPMFERNGSSLRRKVSLLYPILKKSRDLSSGIILANHNLDKLGIHMQQTFSWGATKGDGFGVLPSHYYYKLAYLLNRYQYTAVEVGMKMKGLDNYIQQMVEVLVPNTPKTTKEQVGQKVMGQLNKEWRDVISKLNIKSRDYEGIIFALFQNMFEQTPTFYGFSSASSEELKKKLQHVFKVDPQTILASMCGKHNVRLVKMLDLIPTRSIVPSEMGFPIRIEVNSPTSVLIKGNLEVVCDGGESTKVLPKLKTDLRVLLATQYSGFVKVMCPFTQEYMISGVDEKTTIDVPVKYEFEYIPKEQEVKFSLITKTSKTSQLSSFDLLYHHVRPFTVKSKITDLRPYSELSSFKTISSNQIKSSSGISTESGLVENYRFEFGEQYGLSLEAVLASENKDMSFSTIVRKLGMYNYNLMNMYRTYFASTNVSPLGYPSLRHHEVRCSYKPSQSQTGQIDMDVKVGYATKTEKSQDIVYSYVKYASSTSEQVSEFSYPEWRRLVKIAFKSEPLNTCQRHTERRQKLKEVIQKENIESGRAMVVLYTTVFKTGSGLRGGQVNKGEIRIVKGNEPNSISKKFNVELVKGIQGNGQQEKMCLRGHLVPTTQLPSLDIETIRNNKIGYRFDYQYGVGSSDCTESQVALRGEVKVSPEQVEFSRVSREAKEYETLKRKNVTLAEISRAAVVVRQQASSLDLLNIDVEIKNMPKAVALSQMGVTLVKALYWPYKETVSGSQSMSGASGNQKNSWSVRYHSRSNTITANLTQSGSFSEFEPLYLPYWTVYMMPTSGLAPAQALKRQSPVSMRHERCEISGGLLKTWESEVMPLRIDSCRHLIAGDCSYRKSFAVLANGHANGQKVPKEIKVITGNTEILLSGSGSVSVKVNNTQQSLPSQTTEPKYIKDTRGQTVAILYKTEEGGVEVATLLEPVTYTSMLTVKYVPTMSGRQGFVSVLVDSSYRGRLCGVCGDLSGDQIFDLRGPKRCMYSRPELLVASYRTSTQEHTCNRAERELQNQLVMENDECFLPRTIESKVSMSYLKSSALGSCLRHIHLVVEKPDQLCISRMPVPDCLGQDLSISTSGNVICKPTENLSKDVEYTCFNSGSKLAQDFKQRALNGETIKEMKNFSKSTKISQKLPKSCKLVSGSLYL